MKKLNQPASSQKSQNRSSNQRNSRHQSLNSKGSSRYGINQTSQKEKIAIQVSRKQSSKIERLREIEAQLFDAQKEIKHMPPGHLKYHFIRGHYRYMRRLSSEEAEKLRQKPITYLSRKRHTLAVALARKEYLRRLISDLQKERKALTRYLRAYDDIGTAEPMKDPSGPYFPLLKETFSQLPQELAEWQDAPYPSTAPNPESLLVKGPTCMLRSKSEAMIAWELFNNHIPFRYENDIKTPLGTFHPDFTIRHPKTGEIFIWEHFGLMDDADYAHRCANKIEIYNSIGYTPMCNFIMTFETKMKPFDAKKAASMVKIFFLET